MVEIDDLAKIEAVFNLKFSQNLSKARMFKIPEGLDIVARQHYWSHKCCEVSAKEATMEIACELLSIIKDLSEELDTLRNSILKIHPSQEVLA